MTCFVTFDPAGAGGLVAEGTTLSAAAERLGVDLRLECGGRGECDSCRVTVAEGLERISWPTAAEFARLSDAERGAGERLACQARVEGDCRVSVPPLSAAGGETPPPGEAAGPRGDDAEARARLRDAFESLTPGQRAAAAIEMQLKVVGDAIEALVEAPLKAGSDLLDSLFGAGGRTPPPGARGGTAPADTPNETGPGGDDAAAGGRHDGDQ